MNDFLEFQNTINNNAMLDKRLQFKDEDGNVTTGSSGTQSGYGGTIPTGTVDAAVNGAQVMIGSSGSVVGSVPESGGLGGTGDVSGTGSTKVETGDVSGGGPTEVETGDVSGTGSTKVETGDVSGTGSTKVETGGVSGGGPSEVVTPSWTATPVTPSSIKSKADYYAGVGAMDRTDYGNMMGQMSYNAWMSTYGYDVDAEFAAAEKELEYKARTWAAGYGVNAERLYQMGLGASGMSNLFDVNAYSNYLKNVNDLALQKIKAKNELKKQYAQYVAKYDEAFAQYSIGLEQAYIQYFNEYNEQAKIDGRDAYNYALSTHLFKGTNADEVRQMLASLGYSAEAIEYAIKHLSGIDPGMLANERLIGGYNLIKAEYTGPDSVDYLTQILESNNFDEHEIAQIFDLAEKGYATTQKENTEAKVSSAVNKGMEYLYGDMSLEDVRTMLGSEYSDEVVQAAMDKLTVQYGVLSKYWSNATVMSAYQLIDPAQYDKSETAKKYFTDVIKKALPNITDDEIDQAFAMADSGYDFNQYAENKVKAQEGEARVNGAVAEYIGSYRGNSTGLAATLRALGTYSEEEIAEVVKRLDDYWAEVGDDVKNEESMSKINEMYYKYAESYTPYMDDTLKAILTNADWSNNEMKVLFQRLKRVYNALPEDQRAALDNAWGGGADETGLTGEMLLYGNQACAGLGADATDAMIEQTLINNGLKWTDGQVNAFIENFRNTAKVVEEQKLADLNNTISITDSSEITPELISSWYDYAKNAEGSEAVKVAISDKIVDAYNWAFEINPDGTLKNIDDAYGIVGMSAEEWQAMDVAEQESYFMDHFADLASAGILSSAGYEEVVDRWLDGEINFFKEQDNEKLIAVGLAYSGGAVSTLLEWKNKGALTEESYNTLLGKIVADMGFKRDGLKISWGNDGEDATINLVGSDKVSEELVKNGVKIADNIRLVGDTFYVYMQQAAGRGHVVMAWYQVNPGGITVTGDGNWGNELQNAGVYEILLYMIKNGM